jgi:hypothetical protein
MAFFSSPLPYKLSAEDEAVFASLQRSALLPSIATPGEGELMLLYKANKRHEEEKIVEPYADLLEIELKKLLQERKDAVLAQLHKSKSTTFTVDLFSWNTIQYNESLAELKQRESTMTAEERVRANCQKRDRQREIEAKGWETTFGVECQNPYAWEGDCGAGESWWSYHPLKVDRIFRNSDLALRLSLALGPNFFPQIRWDRVEDAGESGDNGFTVFKKTLTVRYYPFGLPNKSQMDKLLAVAKKDAKRMSYGEKIGYTAGEYPVGNVSRLCVLPEPEDEYADMPRLVRAAASPAAKKAVVSTWATAEASWGAEDDAPSPVAPAPPKKAGVWMPCNDGRGGVVLRDISKNSCFCGCADDDSE